MKYSKVYMILKLCMMLSYIVMIWICKANSRYLCSGSYCFDIFDKMCDIFLAHSNNGIFLFVTEMLQNIFSHFYPWKNLIHDWKRYRNNDSYLISIIWCTYQSNQYMRSFPFMVECYKFPLVDESLFWDILSFCQLQDSADNNNHFS